MAISKTDNSALIIAITEALKDGTISPGGYVELPEKWSKETLPLLEEAAQKRLKKTLDDGGLSRFVSADIQRRYLQSNESLDEDSKPVNINTLG